MASVLGGYLDSFLVIVSDALIGTYPNVTTIREPKEQGQIKAEEIPLVQAYSIVRNLAESLEFRNEKYLISFLVMIDFMLDPTTAQETMIEAFELIETELNT